MANASTEFFYWYRRYKVRAVDMTGFQQAMVESPRAVSEGSFGASVLTGLTAAPVSGYVLGIQPGIAVAASGYVDVLGVSGTIDLSSLAGATPSRSLVVLSAAPEDLNFIPSPTDPFTSVPLNQLQGCSLVLIPGTPSNTPAYPAKGANDVILCGIQMRPGVTGLSTDMIDFEVRESAGRHSELSKNQIHFDDRLRSFRASYKSVAIKSSQTEGSNPLLFSYPGRTTPSIYPKSGGVHSSADTFVDLSTGLITGGDTASSSFTPTIPSGSNSIICAIGLNSDDTLSFAYGIQGTYVQCLNALRQQSTAGAGSVPNTGGVYPIALVIVSAVGGIYSDAQVFDARPIGGGGSGGSSPIFVQEIPSGTVNGSNAAFVLSQTPKSSDSVQVFVDGLLVPKSGWTLSVATVTFGAGYIPAAGQDVYASYVTVGPSTVQGFQEIPTGTINGINDTFALAGVPKDQASTLVYLDGMLVRAQDWSLLQSLGGSSIKFSAGSIPVAGQDIYVVYFK